MAHEPDTARRARSFPRDRRGRGLRRPLFPSQLPGFRTRAEMFDEAVLDAVAELEDRWPGQLSTIEFAVDEVPPLPSGPVLPASDVVVDGGVPLARFVPPGVDAKGRPTKARIVIYRRPVEVRAPQEADLEDLVTDVLEEQISAVLGNGNAPDDRSH